MVEEKSIKEFKNKDDIQSYFVIKKIDKKLSSNHKPYLDMILSDKTGEINAKLWDCTEGQEDQYEVSTLVKVRANVTEWKGKLQLRVLKIREVTQEDDKDIREYIQSAPLDPEEMFNTICEYIERIENKDLYKIVHHMIMNAKERLMYYPAAKSLHHAIRSGLMYHVVRMLESGERLCQVYDHINSDLLYAGILLHDLEKLYELDSNTLGIAEYTKEGQLLGHISMGVYTIGSVGKTLGIDEEMILLLQHMILSHHYEPEFGSPKRPMIIEAEILHHLDMIDARIYDIQQHLESIEPGEFTEPVWSLENRRLYKPKINNN